MASKAAINSQSGNRLDDLEAVISAMQEQIDNLGGGVFRVISVASGSFAPGQSGTFLSKSLADVVGAEVIKIKYLMTSSANAVDTLTLTADGNVIFNNAALCGQTAAANANTSVWGVSSLFTASTSTANVARVLGHIFCSEFTVSKPTGSTTQSVEWVIEYGVIE